MKKILYFSLIVMCLCLFQFPLFSQETGDVNNDGTIDIIDALLVALYFVGLDLPTFNPDLADINCDDTIDIVDALFIAQYFVRIISSFPECQETPFPTLAPTGVMTPIPTLSPTQVPTLPPTTVPTPPGTTAPTPIVTPVGSPTPAIVPTPEPGTSDPTIPPTAEPPTPTPTPILTPIPTIPIENIEWHKKIGGNCGDTPAEIQLTSDNGFIIAAYSCSTNIEGCIFQGNSDFYIIKLDAAGTIQWQRMYGGSDADFAFTICETPDHGYIAAGISDSTDIEGCTNHGGLDSYIVKIDAQGAVQWQTMIGGNDADYPLSIRTTSDNGYIFAGYTRSTDIEGYTINGLVDCYVVKLNSQGAIEWQKVFGGSRAEQISSIQSTFDNGYILAGYSSSSDIEGCINNGANDMYLVKMDNNGIIEWQKMIGGSSFDEAFSIQITPDNGYILAGESQSINIPRCLNYGESDYYAVKCDSEGEVEWQRLIGGSASDWGTSVSITPDNGFVIAGRSNSTDIEGCTNQGEADSYIVKLDANGNTEWQEMIGGSGYEKAESILGISVNSCIVASYTTSTYIQGTTNSGGTDIYLAKLNVIVDDKWQKLMIGGSDYETATVIQATGDNCFIIAGSSSSTDIEGCIHHGYEDYYIVKFHPDATIEWQTMIGGNLVDGVNAMQVTPDNGCIVTGYSESNDIEGCEYNGGESDSYIAKLDAQGNIEWHTQAGGTDEEAGTSIQLTPDNGYIIAGYSGSTDIEGCTNNGSIDYHLVKFDAAGNIEWQKMIGGSGGEWARSILLTPDNGYIISGNSNSEDIEGCTLSGAEDGYIVKLDVAGNIEWQKMIGGSESEWIYSTRITSDNGYLVAGYSKSTDIEGCTHNGGSDYYIVKFNTQGNIEWQKMIGGSSTDYAHDIFITPENNIIIAGSSRSTDIEGCTNHGEWDFYLASLDDEGNIEWQQMIGGNNSDSVNSLQLSPVGDYYYIAGTSHSTDIVGCINHGGSDFFIVKLDADIHGKLNYMFGGSMEDEAYSILNTTYDNNYIAGCTSESSDIEGCTNHGGADFYIVKLEEDMSSEWEVMFGGSGDDECTIVQETPLNGCIAAGLSYSSDIEGCTHIEEADVYIAKLDGEGIIQWQTMFGGSDEDIPTTVQVTSDNGYLIGGYSYSIDIEGCTNAGNADFYMIKLDSAGTFEWQSLLGGSGRDRLFSIQTIPDNGFILAGTSDSLDIDGCINHGDKDYYIVKLDTEGSIEWHTMIGGSGSEGYNEIPIQLASIQVTADNGYIIAGASDSTDIDGCINQGLHDVYIVKLDATGTIEWQTMFGGDDEDTASSIQLTPDNGYIIAGDSFSANIERAPNHGYRDCYIVKLDANGTIEWQKMIGGSNEDSARSILSVGNDKYVIAGYSNSTDIEGANNHGETDCYILVITDIQ